MKVMHGHVLYAVEALTLNLGNLEFHNNSRQMGASIRQIFLEAFV